MVDVVALKRGLLQLMDVDYDEAVKKAKKEEILGHKSLYDDKYYKDLVYTDCSEDALDRLKIVIEFAETPEQHDLWNYFRIFTSSIRTFKNIGRCIRMFIKDEDSGKYLGIFSLASDVREYAARDKFIGWDHDSYLAKLKYVCNITCCVGLRPASFNFNIGKLLVALCHSKEVQEHHYKKYGHYMACITTFSINGKSVQYDRMKPYLEFIGMTKGVGLKEVPEKVYNMALDFLKSIGDQHTLSQGRMMKIIKVCQYLEISDEAIAHNHPRGVYLGFTGTDGKEFLQGKRDTFAPRLQSTDEIVTWWKNRWAKQRYNELKNKGALKTKAELVNLIKQYNAEKAQRSIAKKKEAMGEEEYKKEKAEYMKAYRGGQTEVKNIPDLGTIPELLPQYLAGFIDGDGSIYSKLGTNGDVFVVVSITQCNPFPLIYMQKRYGGFMGKGGNKNPNQRFVYGLCITGRYAEVLLNDIKDYAIVEHEHIQVALQIMNCFHRGAKDEMQQLHTKMCGLAKNKPIDRDYGRVCDEYIAGLFDAEGSIMCINKDQHVSYTLNITQKNDPVLLRKISEYLGYGSCNDVRFNIYKKSNILNFIERTCANTIVKKKQLECTHTLLTSTVTSDQQELLCQTVKAEKHLNYDIDKMDIASRTLELKKSIVLEDKTTPEKSLKIKEQNEIRSERMTGAGNPNFGKERDVDHSTKIALTNVLRLCDKRKVTDEQIDEIFAARASGKTLDDIADEYKVSRQYISNILKKKILKRSEINMDTLKNKVIHKKEKQERGLDRVKASAIGRRSNPAETVLAVLQYKKANPKMSFPAISKESEKLFGKFINPNQVQFYCTGRTKLFDEEFPINGITYETYLSMFDSQKNV